MNPPQNRQPLKSVLLKWRNLQKVHGDSQEEAAQTSWDVLPKRKGDVSCGRQATVGVGLHGSDVHHPVSQPLFRQERSLCLFPWSNSTIGCVLDIRNMAGLPWWNTVRRNNKWFRNVGDVSFGRNPGFNHKVTLESSAHQCMQGELIPRA